jgi:WD40 repeat protein
MIRDALVVGISSYQYLPGLNAPAQDAEAIANLLECDGEFRVTRLPEIVQSGKLQVGVKTPVSLADLEAALVKLFKPKGNNIPHTALFYFSGHGLQKESGICEGYLATSETHPQAHFYGLSLFWLRRLLQESPVRQRIILLDCCHSGEILNYLEADPGAKTGTDRLFMAASREYETAYESLTGQYSVFTQALLDGLDPRRLANGMVTNYALTDWVSNALKGESQQPLFENSGSEIVLTRCQNSAGIQQLNVTQDVCPYRGLEPFNEEHAEYFFGREALTDQLVDKLRSDNFLAIVGASGSGKSSLVKAGLVHKLRRGHAVSGSDRWHIRIMTPTEHPFKSLANAFVNSESSAVDCAEQLRRAETFLQEGGSGLNQLIRASLISQNCSTRMVLIIDQFEEIFTLCQGINAERDRHRFFHALLTALRDLPEQFSVVIVLRADFFSKCSFYKELIERIEQHLVMVTPLTYDQIKASILKPAEKVGLICDPNLVYNILLEIVGAPGELPLLQYTLMELWEHRQRSPEGGSPRLTLDAYAELGGVRGTLQKRANALFYSLKPEEQRIAQRIFIGLTQLGEGTEDTRRRVLKSELVNGQSAPELVEQVLEKLVHAKLVVTNQVVPTSGHQEQVDQRLANISTALRLAQVVKKSARVAQTSDLMQRLPQAQATLTHQYRLNISRLSQKAESHLIPNAMGNGCQETVDIAHEALIRNWGLLRSWLDENREMLRRQRRIERSAREWNAQQVRSPEYLLRGSRLVDADDFLHQYPHELSVLAHRYIAASREDHHRSRRELRFLQVSVPCTLMVALGITFSQYRMALQNQAEKDVQLQIATSRQWSAIAQSLLQESEHDPTTALLISRLAAERGHTYEAEVSLRSALQGLRLQHHWQVSQTPLQQVIFSPDQRWLATLDADNQLVLWSLSDHTVKHRLQLAGSDQHRPSTGQTPAAIAFSGDGKYLVVGSPSTSVHVWDVETGTLRYQLSGFTTPITAMAVSSRNLVAASSGTTVKIWDLATGKQYRQGTHRSPVRQLQFNADGSSLLVTEAQSASLIQVQTYRPQTTFRPNADINVARLSPDNQFVAILTQSQAALWDASTGKLQQVLPFAIPTEDDPKQPDDQNPIPQLTFSPSGAYLAIVQPVGQIQVMQLNSGNKWSVQRPPQAATTPSKQPIAIAFSPTSEQVVLAGHESERAHGNLASLRNSTTGQEMGTLQGTQDAINTLQFSQDGTLIATGSAAGVVQLWTAETGGELASLKLAATPIQWVDFHAAVAPTDSGLSALPLDGQNPANSATPASGETILTVGVDGKFREWEMVEPFPSPTPSSSHPAEASIFSKLQNITQSKQWQWALDRIGSWLWFLDQDTTSQSVILPGSSSSQVGYATHSTTSTPEPIATFVNPVSPEQNLMQQMSMQGKLTSVAVSQERDLIAIANSEGLVEVWQRQPDQAMQRLQILQSATSAKSGVSGPTASDATIQWLSFSRDGQKVLGVSRDKTMQLWDLNSGELLHQFVGHEALIEQAQFSPDGSKIISASWDRTARIWDVASGHLMVTLPQSDVVTSAHFSPDNQRVFVTSLDGTARVIDANTGALQVVLAGHRGAVLDGGFNPEGTLLVTASVDGTARLWDARTGVERTILRSPKPDKTPEPLEKAFFSPSGRYVATLSNSGTVNVWVATWDGLLQLASDRSLRQLKPEECLRYLRLTPKACPSLRLGSNSANPPR